MNGQPDALLLRLAQAAGLRAAWRAAGGDERRVGPDTLRAVLEALGFPCAGPAQCRESLTWLRDEAEQAEGGELRIVRHGAPVILRSQGSLHYRLLLEDGTRVMGTARDLGGGRAAIPFIRRPGYHRLEMGGLRCTVAVIPPHAPPVEGMLNRVRGTGPRAWVLGAQVYGLRRLSAEGDAALGGESVLSGWEAGGDFSLVGKLAAEAAEQGAAALAISPVHAMFSADPQRYSPYAPSSRLFLNALYADPAAVFDADMLGPLVGPPSAGMVDGAGCLDWPGVHALRMEQLGRLFERFEAARPEEAANEFAAFRRQGGEALASHACYEALHAHFAPTLGAAHGWHDWPADYREPDGAAVRRFAATHEKALRFHAFLQWLAARSLAEAQARAAARMPIGLIADMAVGTDPRGSHAWCRQEQIMTGVSVGAPPDVFQPEGQDWGLTAFSPWALLRQGYGGFIETLRAALAHAGGLRVDHVLGLARMWLVPKGAQASEGVYLGYPVDDLMDLLMLEAWRHDAVVVGENLGTVPEGFTSALERRGFLGMSVLWFEREAGEPPRFRPPGQWPVRSMAMATTHDLPTLRGWWAGRDIDWRLRHGEYGDEHATEQRRLREKDKQALWAALRRAGRAGPDAVMPQAAPVAEMLAFVAAAPAVLFNVALEDLTGQEEQINLPGAVPAMPGDRHPNWRRTLALPVEGLLRRGEAPELLREIRRARGLDDPEEVKT